MNKKFYWWTVGICSVIILLKFVMLSFKQPPHKDAAAREEVATGKDPARIAKEWSLTQEKLVVIRISGITTYSAENKSPLKGKARVAYVHEGSADIVVDLTKAEFQYTEGSGTTNLLVVLPDPELDGETIGIDPRKMSRVRSVRSLGLGVDEMEKELDTRCRTKIIDKQWELFSSSDLQKEAKTQARIVLLNLYRQVLKGAVDVDVAFQGTDGAASDQGETRWKPLPSPMVKTDESASGQGEADAEKNDANEGAAQ